MLRALARLLFDTAPACEQASRTPMSGDRWPSTSWALPDIQVSASSAPPALQQQVARALLAREVARGGWAVDLGILGPEAFLDEAAQALSAIALGTAEGGPPSP